MSLHAQLSPEARTRLEAQKRNSAITSVTISLLAISLVVLVLLFVLLPNLRVQSLPLISIDGAAPPDDTPVQRELNPNIQRKPSAPNSSTARVIVTNAPSPIAVPVPEIASEPSALFGNGTGDGTDFGEGMDPGGKYNPIPGVMKKRCSREDRLQRLQASGGNEKCEEAVLAALRWMKDSQAKGGSWGGNTKVAYTGLALLAFLGHCETPTSVEFGDCVTNSITFLINNCQKNKGRMASNLQDKHWSYSHAIATYALAEAFTFGKAENAVLPGLQESVQQSVQWIIDNQNQSGGWEYSYQDAGNRGGDMSITAWQMQALKAGKHTGLEFRNLRSCISKALAYCEKCQAGSGAFGYAGPAPLGKHATLTGAGTLCFQQHKGAANSQARKGIRYLDKESTFNYKTGPCNLYEHYYSSQATINHGGKSWEAYNKMFRDQLLEHQNKDGSWPAPPQPGPGARGDAIYVTSLATLMLEVYYRFLPGTAAGK